MPSYTCDFCHVVFVRESSQRFCSRECFLRMPTAVTRLMKKIVKTETCWLWTGYTAKNGYGQMSDDTGKLVYVHRFSYELSKGNIPDGLHLDHLCRVRHCVNPNHLEPVTSSENTRRGDLSGNGWKQREQTHCIHGHEFTLENTRLKKEKYGTGVSRSCRECARQRVRKRRAALKTKTAEIR